MNYYLSVLHRFWNKLIIRDYKKYDSDQTTTAYHEAGHAVISHIFYDLISVEFISLIPVDDNTGYNKISIKKINGDIYDHFNFISANLAGIIVEKLYLKHNDDTTLENLVKYLNSRLKVNKDDSFRGDYNNLTRSLKFVSSNVNKEEIKVLIDSLTFIYKSLNDHPILWENIELISKKLLINQKLKNSEIKIMFKKSGLSSYLTSNNKTFQELAKNLLMQSY